MSKNEIRCRAKLLRSRSRDLVRGGFLAVLVGTVSMAAQQPTGGTGTVTGHVVADDTQRPARFAEVVLLAKPGKDEPNELAVWTPDGKGPSIPGALLSDHSSLDGSYAIENVPVGDYYVFAKLPGYVLPLSNGQSDLDLHDLKKTLAGVPLVHVVADHAVTADLTLVRGAALSGTVTFEDGSPVAGMPLQLEPLDGMDPETHGSNIALGFAMGSTNARVTNDRGLFRIAGVRPGKYRIQIMMTVRGGQRWARSGSMLSPAGFYEELLPIFAPGTFHQRDAQIVEVRGGEEIPDIDIKISLDTTHSVSGQVVAKDDRHVPTQNRVELKDTADKDFRRVTMADSNGSFHFSYIPAGTYTVEVRSHDLEAKDLNRQYDVEDVAVTVAAQDVNLGGIQMNPSKAAEKNTSSSSSQP